MVAPRERRTLMLGAAVVVAAWLALRGIPAVLRHVEAERTAVARLALTVARHEQLQQHASTLEAEFAVLRQRRTALRDRALHDCEAAICVDDAQVAVEDAVADLPVALEEITAELDSVRIGALRRIRLDLLLETDAAGLAELVGRLRTQTLRLDLDAMRIEAADPGAAQGAERLRVQLTLGAWAEVGAT